MIDIVFGDSACGSLRIAQHYGEGEYKGGATAVFLTDEESADAAAAQQRAEEAARREWEEGIPMGGSPEDVYCISLALDIGDISESIPGRKREDVLEALSPVPAEGKRILTDSLRALRSVLARTSGGEAVRLWYSSAPEEMCGL